MQSNFALLANFKMFSFIYFTAISIAIFSFLKAEFNQLHLFISEPLKRLAKDRIFIYSSDIFKYNYRRRLQNIVSINTNNGQM